MDMIVLSLHFQVLNAFLFYLAQVCLHKPTAAVVRGLFYIKMSGGGEGGREALVLLFLSLSRPSHLYLSRSVIEWDLYCWLYEYKAQPLQWGVKAIYSTQILFFWDMRYFGKSIAFEIMFCVDSFGKFTGASKDNTINVWNCVSLITFLAHWLY